MSNEHLVTIPLNGISLEGRLGIPESPTGVVVFAHAIGTGVGNPRSVLVARELRASYFATVITDLLTPEEASDDAKRLDIALLAARLEGVLQWVETQEGMAGFPVGLFGAGTGAAAALRLAALAPGRVAAVVSRGGRPDLAGDAALLRVRAPALFIVGGEDRETLAFNRSAITLLRGPCSLEVVPGATHLFEEPGALETVARLAGDWFARNLATSEEPVTH